MAILHEGPSPYAPVAHVLRALDHSGQKAPQAFSKELLMRLGYPEAYARRTMAALKLLDLIDDEGQPTQSFMELRQASAEEYTPRLEQVIRTAYADAFAVVDPATDSDQAINDAFRFYQPAAQRDKMVTLFMGLCEAGGIIGADRAPRKRLRTVKNESGRKVRSSQTRRSRGLAQKGRSTQTTPSLSRTRQRLVPKKALPKLSGSTAPPLHRNAHEEG